jgi:hypothetical protein
MGTTDHLEEEERFLAALGMTTGDSLGPTEKSCPPEKQEWPPEGGRYKGPATAVRNR